MTTIILPPITVIEPRVPYPFPSVPITPIERPILPNIDVNRGQFTNLVQLYNGVKVLDEQLDELGGNIDFILSQLSPEEKFLLSGDIQTLRQLVANAKTNADVKFAEQLSRTRLWNFYNSPQYQTEPEKLNFVGVGLSMLSGNFYRQNWEQEYGVARRNEIEVKQKLVDAYRDILPALNEAYLPKFYPDYVHFPARSQAAASKVVELIGALNLHDGFLDNKVEILISDGLLTRMGSQFGHVAINIGGVIYGRAPDAWDIRGKEKYLSDQGDIRNTIGYVIQLDEAKKQKLFTSVLNKIVKDEKYSVIDHSCSGEIISSFAELGINIVDPRWTVGDVYAPADIDNFLQHSKQVIDINAYPKKQLLRASARVTLNA
jgi:hypothetical protein